jgi:hypothetical protein
MKDKIEITQHSNNLPDTKPVFENFGVYLDDINENLPRHNGTIWGIIGKGGSGKSSMFLSLFKSKEFLRGKFDEVHYIVREGSFNSVKGNPFQHHDKVHHELTPELLHEIHEDALERKEDSIENDTEIEHTCVIIDDFGAQLKDLDIQYALKQIMNVARHAGLYIVFICQTYRMIPSELRRILTHVTIFRPNTEEWDLICKEILLKKKQVCAQIYDYVFDKLYNHLTINMKDGSIRKNFKLLEITE